MAEVISVPMTRQGRDGIIAISCLWVIFAIVVFFRLVGRLRGAGIGPDDVLSCVALILSSTTIGMSAAVFRAGVGIDFDPSLDVFPKLMVNMPYIMQITFAFTLIYLWTLVALKLSQLCLYMRVFAVHIRNWILAGMAMVIVWGIIYTFIMTFLCIPVKQQWSLERIGKCMNQIEVLMSLIMTNIVTDIFIFILPIHSVWKLQMRKTEKMAVISCFALGAACVVIGIVRFWEMFVIDLLGNLTGTSLTTFLLCSIEIMLAGLCINIPMLRPFYLRWRTKHKLSGASGSNRDSNFKSYRTDPLVAAETGQRNHTAWIELDHETCNDDDGSSERKLTTTDDSAGITISKNWSVASTKQIPT